MAKRRRSRSVTGMSVVTSAVLLEARRLLYILGVRASVARQSG